MKAYEIMKLQKNASPRNPKLGQVWFEPYTRTLRVWNGLLWWETTPKEMTAAVGKYGSTAKWMQAMAEEKPGGK